MVSEGGGFNNECNVSDGLKRTFVYYYVHVLHSYYVSWMSANTNKIHYK